MSKNKDNVIGMDRGSHVVITQETVQRRFDNAGRLIGKGLTSIKNFGEDTLAKPITPIGIGGAMGAVAGTLGMAVAGWPGVGLVCMGIGMQTVTDLLIVKSFQLRGFEMVKVRLSRLEQELNQPLPLGDDDTDS